MLTVHQYLLSYSDIMVNSKEILAYILINIIYSFNVAYTEKKLCRKCLLRNRNFLNLASNYKETALN